MQLYTVSIIWFSCGHRIPPHPPTHLHLNKIAILCANNFLSKRDASNLKSDSETLAKSGYASLYLEPSTATVYNGEENETFGKLIL